MPLRLVFDSSCKNNIVLILISLFDNHILPKKLMLFSGKQFGVKIITYFGVATLFLKSKFGDVYL